MMESQQYANGNNFIASPRTGPLSPLNNSVISSDLAGQEAMNNFVRQDVGSRQS